MPWPTYNTWCAVQPPPLEGGEGGKDGAQAASLQPSASKGWFWRWPGRHQNEEGKSTPVDNQETAGLAPDEEVGTTALWCVHGWVGVNWSGGM